jgi:hypothetical protein
VPSRPPSTRAPGAAARSACPGRRPAGWPAQPPTYRDPGTDLGHPVAGGPRRRQEALPTMGVTRAMARRGGVGVGWSGSVERCRVDGRWPRLMRQRRTLGPQCPHRSRGIPVSPQPPNGSCRVSRWQTTPNVKTSGHNGPASSTPSPDPNSAAFATVHRTPRTLGRHHARNRPARLRPLRRTVEGHPDHPSAQRVQTPIVHNLVRR